MSNHSRHPDPAFDGARIPPQSIEAEQSVLGALLLENAALDRILDTLAESDFYRYDHRLIFKHTISLITSNRPADVITVFEALRAVGRDEEVGGLSYLNALAQNTPSAANIRHYADLVRDNSLRRRLLSATDEIAADVYAPAGRSGKELADAAEAKIMAVSEEGARGSQNFQQVGAVLPRVVDRLDQLASRENPDAITGTPTGFDELDQQLSGMQDGDLIIIAGRPSMGKSAKAANIAEHVAIELGKPVAFFSMEMSAEQLTSRMVGSIGRIDQQRLRSGTLIDEEWPRLTVAMEKLSKAPLFIEESTGLTALEVSARARRLARAHGKLGLIIVDYLQLMAAAGTGENRATEVSEMSRQMKWLAKEMRCPVIALSQLNRELEKRHNKRPIMSDLRESGGLEQDADVILFIYRDEVYNPDSPDKGTAEIIVAKQRTGPTGTIRETWRGEHTRFDNYSGTKLTF